MNRFQENIAKALQKLSILQSNLLGWIARENILKRIRESAMEMFVVYSLGIVIPIFLLVLSCMDLSNFSIPNILHISQIQLKTGYLYGTAISLYGSLSWLYIRAYDKHQIVMRSLFGVVLISVFVFSSYVYSGILKDHIPEVSPDLVNISLYIIVFSAFLYFILSMHNSRSVTTTPEQSFNLRAEALADKVKQRGLQR